MKLIKNGKQFDLSGSILVAVSQWYMNYELQVKYVDVFEITEG